MEVGVAMNCEWVRPNVTLYVYDELSDDARYELEQHLNRCRACAAEVEATRAFRTSLSALRRPEPSPNLLAASRMRLQEALETTEQARGWWYRWAYDFSGWLHQVKFSPALATVLLMMGFAGGIGATYSLIDQRDRERTAVTTADLGSGTPQEAAIAAIRGISQQPDTGKVQIRYDQLVPTTLEGTLDDPRVQELLLAATRNTYNSGVRIESVDLLMQKPEDEEIRQALIYALRYDTNPGVRLRALEGLSSWVAEDIRVRNAVIEALLNDSNPGVRAEAIHLLEPVKADASVRQALNQLARQEKNVYLRRESRAVLATVPEID
jgi:hypothetical protein